MIINLAQNTTSSEEEQKLIYNILRSLVDYYKIKPKHDDMQRILLNGAYKMADWAKTHLNITMTYWHFDNVAYGYDVTEDEHLTAYLLTIDLTKKIVY